MHSSITANTALSSDFWSSLKVRLRSFVLYSKMFLEADLRLISEVKHSVLGEQGPNTDFQKVRRPFKRQEFGFMLNKIEITLATIAELK